MNDASGENVDEHVEALEGEMAKLQQSMDNDNAHLDPRYVHEVSCFQLRWLTDQLAVGSLPRLFSP
jgi:hypothetical protein